MKYHACIRPFRCPGKPLSVEVLLEEFSLAAAEDHEPEYSFMTSADEEYLSRLIAKSERAKTLDLD